ncbi:hypothetical protein Hypma_005488 [Hypsizygus marmoreus]|uniref:Uncharacterized protein n=1 Tax=Hypsizygus marmoreus TaxID=39966 RepID=A0A369J5P8_HYPMA|nr:hypothetical protein Hypma_005488 [Hypsizygus marmoreus]
MVDTPLWKGISRNGLVQYVGENVVMGLEHSDETVLQGPMFVSSTSSPGLAVETALLHNNRYSISNQCWSQERPRSSSRPHIFLYATNRLAVQSYYPTSNPRATRLHLNAPERHLVPTRIYSRTQDTALIKATPLTTSPATGSTLTTPQKTSPFAHGQHPRIRIAPSAAHVMSPRRYLPPCQITIERIIVRRAPLPTPPGASGFLSPELIESDRGRTL